MPVFPQVSSRMAISATLGWPHHRGRRSFAKGSWIYSQILLPSNLVPYRGRLPTSGLQQCYSQQRCRQRPFSLFPGSLRAQLRPANQQAYQSNWQIHHRRKRGFLTFEAVLPAIHSLWSPPPPSSVTKLKISLSCPALSLTKFENIQSAFLVSGMRPAQAKPLFAQDSKAKICTQILWCFCILCEGSTSSNRFYFFVRVIGVLCELNGIHAKQETLHMHTPVLCWTKLHLTGNYLFKHEHAFMNLQKQEKDAGQLKNPDLNPKHVIRKRLLSWAKQRRVAVQLNYLFSSKSVFSFTSTDTDSFRLFTNLYQRNANDSEGNLQRVYGNFEEFFGRKTTKCVQGNSPHRIPECRGDKKHFCDAATALKPCSFWSVRPHGWLAWVSTSARIRCEFNSHRARNSPQFCH